MFTAALVTIAKTWKQLKYTSTDEWIKNKWYIYTMEYYTAIKKNKNAICKNMDGTRVSHTKYTKSERERQLPYDITYFWNLIYSTNETFGIKENHGLGQYTCVCKWGKGREWDGLDWEFGVNRCKLLLLECIQLYPAV